MGGAGADVGDNAVTLPPATVPWPNSGALNLTGDYVWVRFVHDDDGQADHDLDVDERDDVHVVRRADPGRRSTSTSPAA